MPESFEQQSFDGFDLIQVTETPGGTELIDSPIQVFPVNFPIDAMARMEAVSIRENIDISELSTEEKTERAISAITRLLRDGRPLCVAYSGGKDSSVMAALVIEAARRMREAGETIPTILFTHARTGIDNPAMEMVTRVEIERIRKYAVEQEIPVRVDIAEPSLNDSWAARIISGRALPTFANSSTRDCSISWKLVPQQRQRKIALKELKVTGEPVILVGTRFDESSGRASRMTERGELDTEVWEVDVRNKTTGKIQRTEHHLSPIAHWTQEDIWVFLADLENGRRQSYTDAVDLSDAYRDGGNSSCVVVSDDSMKSSAKACGARFGCALCTAVGRDKSLESMLEADEKYQFLIPLNRLQRFLVDTQYDMNRRSWLGRTISDDGYIAIAPDAYSPKMQRDLLAYSLTIDRNERIAARKLGIEPRFELVSLKQLIAIDAIWSIQGYHPRPFEAIHIWEAVNIKGRSFVPPEINPNDFEKKIPGPRWLHVGSWDSDPGFDPEYNGARHFMADFVGATGDFGCLDNMTLDDGRVVLSIDKSSLFDVDQEGAELFMEFEVMDREIHKIKAGEDPGAAFGHYQLLGTLSTGKKHVGMIDDMLRRSAWKRRHGVFEMKNEQLLARSVSTSERSAGLLCPEGQETLAVELARKINAQHDAREQTRFRERM